MFARIFQSILDSSLWLEPDPHRIVWFTLLLSMDQNGFARFATVENLARRARVPTAVTALAVEKFSAPDPNSSDPENEGRRIEKVPGGFQILNAAKYRALMRSQDQREQNRQRAQRHRDRDKSVTKRDAPLRPISISVPVPVQEGGTGEGERSKAWPTLEEVKKWASMECIPEKEAVQFWDHFESMGWVSKGGQPIRNARAKLRVWHTNQANNPINGKPAKQTIEDAISRGHDAAIARIRADVDNFKKTYG